MNLLFNTSSNTGSFFIGAGPSLSFALSGITKYDDGTDSFSENIKFGNEPDNDDLKGLDLGVNMLTGFQFPNGLFFSGGYNAGFSNLFPGGSSDGTLKSHYFSIKIGIMLNSKTKNK